MKVAVFFTACLIGIASARIIDTKIDDATEVCYDYYGCFTTAPPWTHLVHRPLSALPRPPYEVGTRFLLFTRGDPDYLDVGYELIPGKEAILKFSDFKAERKTYFLIHGFTDDHRVEWIKNTKDLLLKNEDANIIAIDWSEGAKPTYLQATADARLAGAQVARMITFLEQYGELNIQDIHIISHSLGGHVAAYTGDRLMGRIPRITAIDPTHLYFTGSDPVVRLDETDAQFVEVIHSNTNEWDNFGMGMREAIGHIDLYPNGGSKQPGCKDTLGNLIDSILKLITWDFEGAISTWACSHARAAHYYAESISSKDSCPFVSFQCSNYAEFEKGNCYSACNGEGNCVPLGYKSKQYQASGVYYLHTTDGSSSNGTYCKQVVQVQVPVSLSQSRASGSLTLAFQSEDGTLSEGLKLVDGATISPGEIIQRWVEVPSCILKNAEDKLRLMLLYTRGGPLQPNTLAIDGVFLNVIKADLTTVSHTYHGSTLATGHDTPISD